MILVLGSTGNIGGEVTRQLINKGEKPRLLVRNRSKAIEFTDKAEIIEGDLADPGTRQAAVKDVEKLFLVASGLEGFELEKQVIDAAKQADVHHIVKLSALGADRPALTVSRWHAEVEKHLMESGLGWTMLRPGNFMTNAIMFWADTIKTQNAFYQPTGEGSWPSIAPADIAVVAVQALTSPNHEGQGYALTGNEPMNAAEYAEVLSDVLGRKITFVDIPPDVARDGMLKSGMPVEYVDAVMNLMAAMRAGQGNIVTDTFEQLTGRKPTSFTEWARQNVAAFQ